MLTPEELTPASFRSIEPIQLRFNDIDVMGHVNNSVYNNFYDLGKSAYFNALPGKRDWRAVDIVLAHIDCSFLAPIHFAEKVAVATRCTSIGEKSFTLDQMIFNTDTGQMKSVAETVMVGIDPATEKSSPISDAWRAMLCGFEGRDLNRKPTSNQE